MVNKTKLQKLILLLNVSTLKVFASFNFFWDFVCKQRAEGEGQRAKDKGQRAKSSRQSAVSSRQCEV